MLVIIQIIFKSSKINIVTFNIIICSGFSVETKVIESHSYPRRIGSIKLFFIYLFFHIYV